MATILDLLAEKSLVKLDPCLPDPSQEYRCVYTSVRLMNWASSKLLALESTWRIEISPAEQLAELMECFCSGATLTYGWQFKPLTHIRDGVWELKTADIRMFGWFYKKDCFIGVSAEAKDHIKRYNLYHGLAGEVVRFRDTLDLDEPKFIAGDNPHDVVSDFNFP